MHGCQFLLALYNILLLIGLVRLGDGNYVGGSLINIRRVRKVDQDRYHHESAGFHKSREYERFLVYAMD